MSLRIVMEALMSLRLTENEALVYICLAKKGPLEEKDLAKKIKLSKKQLSMSLERLLAKGIVNSLTDRSTKYSAIAFEKVLDQFMEATKSEAAALEASKEGLLSTWQTMIKESSINN